MNTKTSMGPQIWMGDEKYRFPRERRMEDVHGNRLDVKPYGGLWTSTYTPNNDNDSDWIRWCRAEDYWTGNYGFKLEPESDLNIITVNGLDDLRDVADKYGKDTYMGYDSTLHFDEMKKDGFDGLHLTRRGQAETRHTDTGDPHLHGWDAESTLWFDWKFYRVEYLGHYE